MEQDEEYAVVSSCTGCGKCIYVCPENCIKGDTVPHYIDPENCIRCGACAQACPVEAIKLL